ncbi:1,4-dihydroxy-2-naphthoate octaprenyltransferase [Maribacter aestuarii]|uniref:1,4-dihydroxy-2-naphthoate octaprenyltransferase n=1 Tax=Maribacter aestuarii TaxID=1130723 RepID=UPI0025A54282|nr:1,4-dihydroxy-2-naphthoate octaprenyltransferase [Maribacter aestuarii]
MSKIGAWVNAARLRTLPLSISGILVGTGMAGFYGTQNSLIFVLALLTTVGFQVTSNFANDYGDGIKGTDNEGRIGPARALQSGLLSPKALKQGIFISIGITMIFVLVLLFAAFGIEGVGYILIFLLLAISSIWAAIKYTMGNTPYGYRGFGDLSVFVFFGLAGVLGAMFLYIKTIPLLSVLPALSIGLLSVGVLNLNNLRDLKSDKLSGKNTVVVKLGFKRGKIYHYLLLSASFLFLVVFIMLTKENWVQFISLLAYVPIVVHLLKVKSIQSPLFLDPELKKLALSTFLMALLFYFSYNYFL